MAGPMKGARARFAVTFETFTHESAEQGEAAARGVVTETATLRDCVPSVCDGFSSPRFAGYAEPDSTQGRVRSLRFPDYREDYRTGESEARTLRVPDGVTVSASRRVARLFEVKL